MFARHLVVAERKHKYYSHSSTLFHINIYFILYAIQTKCNLWIIPMVVALISLCRSLSFVCWLLVWLILWNKVYCNSCPLLYILISNLLYGKPMVFKFMLEVSIGIVSEILAAYNSVQQIHYRPLIFFLFWVWLKLFSRCFSPVDETTYTFRQGNENENIRNL